MLGVTSILNSNVLVLDAHVSMTENGCLHLAVAVNCLVTLWPFYPLVYNFSLDRKDLILSYVLSCCNRFRLGCTLDWKAKDYQCAIV